MNAEEWKKAQAQLRAADNDRYWAGVCATGEALDRYARQAEEAKQVPQRTLTAVEKIVANQEKLLEIQQQTAEILQKKAGRGNKDSGITARSKARSVFEKKQMAKIWRAIDEGLEGEQYRLRVDGLSPTKAEWQEDGWPDTYYAIYQEDSKTDDKCRCPAISQEKSTVKREMEDLKEEDPEEFFRIVDLCPPNTPNSKSKRR